MVVINKHPKTSKGKAKKKARVEVVDDGSGWVRLKEDQLKTIKDPNISSWYGQTKVVFQVKVEVAGTTQGREVDLPVFVHLKKDGLKVLRLDATEPPDIAMWAVSAGGHRRARGKTLTVLWALGW